MSVSQNPQTKVNFLFNLPGLLYYLDLKLWSEVKEAYLNLLNDNTLPDVRGLALLIFHQVVQICGFKNFK
jgi:hypothetical protein